MLTTAAFRSKPFQPSNGQAAEFMMQNTKVPCPATIDQIMQMNLVELFDKDGGFLRYGPALCYTHVPVKS